MQKDLRRARGFNEQIKNTKTQTPEKDMISANKNTRKKQVRSRRLWLINYGERTSTTSTLALGYNISLVLGMIGIFSIG